MSNKHISPGIAADLQKLDPSHRAEIRRVAGKDTENMSARGENRPVRAVGMDRKVAASRIASRLDPIGPPCDSPVPRANWPANHSRLVSGVAQPTAHPSLPSPAGPKR
jgi:hypothetical protein